MGPQIVPPALVGNAVKSAELVTCVAIIGLHMQDGGQVLLAISYPCHASGGWQQWAIFTISAMKWCPVISPGWHDIDGLVQDCSKSIANTLKLLQSCTKPSILSTAIVYDFYHTEVQTKWLPSANLQGTFSDTFCWIKSSTFLAATKQLYEWYFPSVCPSVHPYRIILKFSGVITNDQSKVHAKGQGHRGHNPT